MKKLLALLFLFSLGIFYSQCSTDPECNQIDWIGVYQFERIELSCNGSQADNNFPDEMVIEAGSSDGKILINEIEFDFTECSVELDFGIFEIGYGEFRVFKTGCSATYTKN